MISKTNSIFMLLFFAFGCFIGNKFKDSAHPPDISQKQDQTQGQKQGQESKQDCSVEVVKKTHPDGSIEEFLRLRAANALKQGQEQNQAQAQKQEIKVDESTIDIFAGGGVGQNIKPWGSVEVVAGSHSFEYIQSGSEWVGLYKIKLLSF